MDADTISKNGTSLKSLTSRGNIFRKTCFALIAVSIFFVSNTVQGQTAKYTKVESKMVDPFKTDWESRGEIITISKTNVSGKSGFCIKIERNGNLYSEYNVTFSRIDDECYFYEGKCKILQVRGDYKSYDSAVLCMDKLGDLSEKKMTNSNTILWLMYRNHNNNTQYTTAFLF